MRRSTQQIRGLWVDIIFILLSFYVLPRIGYRLEELLELSFRDSKQAFYIVGSVVIVAFFWRWIALYLKRFAFERRNETTERNLGIFWFAYLPSAILSFAFVAALISVPLKEAQVADFMEGETFIGITALLFLGIEGWLIFNLNPRSEMEFKDGDWRFEHATELFADTGLFAYIFVWQCFYNFVIATVMPDKFDSVFIAAGFLLFSLIVFVFFYAGPRLLFLMEDGRRNATWVRIGLVFVVSFAAHLLW